MRSTTFVMSPMGRDLIAASLPAGEARGIVIDNPSGSWLYLPGTQDYIAPYVVGWTRTLPGVASIDVQFAEIGPAGQVSTLDGDFPRVWLDSEPVADSTGIASPGAPFIERFTPVQLAVQVGLARCSIQTIQDIVTAIPDKRFRVLSAAIAYDFPGATGTPNGTAPVVVSTSFGFYMLMPGQFVHSSFPEGADHAPGQAVQWAFSGTWKDESIILSITYQTI